MLKDLSRKIQKLLALGHRHRTTESTARQCYGPGCLLQARSHTKIYSIKRSRKKRGKVEDIVLYFSAHVRYIEKSIYTRLESTI
jgi:hypothetical protein